MDNVLHTNRARNRTPAAELEDELTEVMHGPQDLIAGYQRFRAHVYSHQVATYRKLGMSQNPSILVVACADSRADPATIFDAGPGQLFVVRNVANLVPPYEADSEGQYHGVSAALEYAVTILKVQHVVVMGHGGCGGIAACLSTAPGNPDGGAPLGKFIGPWVSMLNDARDRVLASGSFNEQYALELEGIDQSLANLRTFPFVQDAEQSGQLELHGAWFAIHHGELHWRNRVTSRFELVPGFTKASMPRAASMSVLKSPPMPPSRTSTRKVPPLPIQPEEGTLRVVAGSSEEASPPPPPPATRKVSSSERSGASSFFIGETAHPGPSTGNSPLQGPQSPSRKDRCQSWSLG